jgi:hypothetical protein
MKRFVFGLAFLLAVSSVGLGQSPSVDAIKGDGSKSESGPVSKTTTASGYVDPLQGASSNDLVRRALSSNAELAAIRLDIERGRARLHQAALRPILRALS